MIEKAAVEVSIYFAACFTLSSTALHCSSSLFRRMGGSHHGVT